MLPTTWRYLKKFRGYNNWNIATNNHNVAIGLSKSVYNTIKFTKLFNHALYYWLLPLNSHLYVETVFKMIIDHILLWKGD